MVFPVAYEQLEGSQAWEGVVENLASIVQTNKDKPSHFDVTFKPTTPLNPYHFSKGSFRLRDGEMHPTVKGFHHMVFLERNRKVSDFKKIAVQRFLESLKFELKRSG